MSQPEEKPEIVDLRRYRQDKARAARAAEEKAREARKAQDKGQPILGSRPGAAVIIIVIIAVFVAAWLAPKLF